jgi:lactate dehydrogenase-like 2-hydroxyacid dehydrogenase
VTRSLKLGFGCEVLAFDPVPNPEIVELGIPYVPPEEIAERSDLSPCSAHLRRRPATSSRREHRPHEA